MELNQQILKQLLDFFNINQDQEIKKESTTSKPSKETPSKSPSSQRSELAPVVFPLRKPKGLVNQTSSSRSSGSSLGTPSSRSSGSSPGTPSSRSYSGTPSSVTYGPSSRTPSSRSSGSSPGTPSSQSSGSWASSVTSSGRIRAEKKLSLTEAVSIYMTEERSDYTKDELKYYANQKIDQLKDLQKIDHILKLYEKNNSNNGFRGSNPKDNYVGINVPSSNIKINSSNIMDYRKNLDEEILKNAKLYTFLEKNDHYLNPKNPKGSQGRNL